MKQEMIDRNIASITESLERIFANHQKYFWRDQDKELPGVRYCQLQGNLNSCLTSCCCMEVLFYDLAWGHCMEYLIGMYVWDRCMKYPFGNVCLKSLVFKIARMQKFIMFIFFQFQDFEQQ